MSSISTVQVARPYLGFIPRAYAAEGSVVVAMKLGFTPQHAFKRAEAGLKRYRSQRALARR